MPICTPGGHVQRETRVSCHSIPALRDDLIDSDFVLFSKDNQHSQLDGAYEQ